MLPRRYRLTRKEFDLVRKNGQLIPGRLFALLALFPPILPISPISPISPKSGLIVSLKLSKKAVVRNQLKRRLRAALQSVLPLIKKPIHLVVLPNHLALDSSVRELENEIKVLLQKSGCLTM